jgi:hypothetical protein
LVGLALLIGGSWLARKINEAWTLARLERRRLAESALKQAAYRAYWRGWQDKEEGVEGNAERGHEAGSNDIRDALRLLG